MLYGRGGAAELDLHPAFHAIRDKPLVRVASRYHSVRIVRFIVQRHAARARLEHHYDSGLGVPIGKVFGDELKMKNGRR